MNLGDVNKVSMVDCDSKATGFLRNAYEGARLLGDEMLIEAGRDVRVQDSVCLLGED